MSRPANRNRRSPRLDHVGRLIEQRRRESPELPLDGMEILARARRLTLLTRPGIEAVFRKHGVDTGEFDVLASLRRSGAPYALRPTELFQALMISSGGLTDRLQRLEARGLILREASPADARSILVRLSARGKSLIDLAFEEDMRFEEALLAPLGAAQRRQLARLLAKLLLGLEQQQG